MSTFNVLRYSLLGAGLVYGAVHRYSLESEVKEQQRISQWNKELKLIKQAKEEYARTHAVAEKPQASAGSINWEDPNLDIGKATEVRNGTAAGRTSWRIYMREKRISKY